MADAQSAKRYDWGSSISMIWNPTFTHLAVGFSRDDMIYKFPCGKIEEGDFRWNFKRDLMYGFNPDPEQYASRDSEPDFNRPINAVARICALRELGNETDEAVIEHLDMDSLFQLRYVRTFEKRQEDGSKLPLAQYHFVGQLRQRVDFWSPPAESSEMEIPEWWTPLEILRVDKTETRKMNPIHQIAFAAGLREMRAMFKVGDLPALDAVFAQIIRIPLLQPAGASAQDAPTTDLFNYEEKVWALVRSRRI